MQCARTIRRIGVAGLLMLATFAPVAGSFASAGAQAPEKRLPALPSIPFPSAAQDFPYSSSVAAVGGTGTYTFSISGQVPNGLVVETSPTTFALRGVPTSSGLYDFSVTATDSAGNAVSHNYSINVQGPLFQPFASLVRVVDNETVKLSDGDSAFRPAAVADPEGIGITDVDQVFFPAKVSLKEGIVVSDAAKIFFPAVVNDVETVKVADVENVFFPVKVAAVEAIKVSDADSSLAAATVHDAESVKISDAVSVSANVGVLPSTAPAGTYNVPYRVQFLAVGASGVPSLIPSGTLPAGMSFTTSIGTVLLQGTPTVAGSFPFTIKAIDSASTAVDIINYTLVINPASQTITLGTIPTPTYGGAAFSLGATASSGLTPTFTLNSGPATGTGAGPYTATGAGTVSFTASQAGNASYAAATPVPFNVVVSPAPLAVKATAASRYFDQPNPVLSDTITGFVNGDPPSVVSGSPTLSTTATPISPVSGSPYAVTVGQGSLSAANYNLGFTNGSLTINAAPQTITFYPLPPIPHGSAAFPLTARASSGLAVAYTVTGPATISNSMLTVTGPGLVTVTANQSGNANYSAAPPVVRSFTAP